MKLAFAAAGLLGAAGLLVAAPVASAGPNVVFSCGTNVARCAEGTPTVGVTAAAAADDPEQPIFYNQYVREAASPAGYITEALTGVPIDEQDDIGLPGYTGSLYWTCTGPGCWNGGNPMAANDMFGGAFSSGLTGSPLGGGGGVPGEQGGPTGPGAGGTDPGSSDPGSGGGPSGS